MNSDNQVPFFKSTGIVDIQVSAGFVQRLQRVIDYIVSPHSQEELDAFKKKLADKVPLEPWEESFFTLTVLVTEIEKKAVATGQVVYRGMSELSK